MKPIHFALPSAADVNELLMPLAAPIWQAADLAIERCLEIQRVHGAWGPRLRANFVWEQFNEEFTRLAKTGKLKLRRIDDRFSNIFYEVAERFLIRFKKVTKGRISRIKTAFSDAFLGQQLLFEDQDSSTNLVLAYELDETATTVSSIYFALCGIDNQVEWQAHLPRPGAQVHALPAGQPSLPFHTDIATAVAKVRKDARKNAGG